MAAAFFRGTQLDQNVKFKDKEKQLIKQMQWPESFDKPVDLSKVSLDVINDWIEKRITSLLGMEDDIVCNYAQSQLEECINTSDDNKNLCPKKMQVMMTGFLEDKTQTFMIELWDLLLSAQDAESGIPAQLIKEKLDEKVRKQEELDKAHERLEKLRLLSGQKQSNFGAGQVFGKSYKSTFADKLDEGKQAVKQTEKQSGFHRSRAAKRFDSDSSERERKNRMPREERNHRQRRASSSDSERNYKKADNYRSRHDDRRDHRRYEGDRRRDRSDSRERKHDKYRSRRSRSRSPPRRSRNDRDRDRNDRDYRDQKSYNKHR